VIEEGEQIYGDGVNIAARLEGLAEAGGICISESAYQQIENKLPLSTSIWGASSQKHYQPVRVYKAQIEPETYGKAISDKKPKPRQWQRAILSLVVVLIVVAAAIAIYYFYFRPTPRPIEIASKEKNGFPIA